MNHLAEESPSIMKVSHSNQLLKMPSGVNPTITQITHFTPSTVSKSLYKNCSRDLNYKVSIYADVIPPVRGLRRA
ncbi:MAG: hypothetical protein KC646_01740 [Candidatus Cloacimonetes bacterium]|nr:hypothetical protein [Candidatus Cloacimonadota bacterium]